MNPIEHRIRSVTDADVYEAIRDAFPGKADSEIVADLTRLIVLVAVCWNDVVEGGQDADTILGRNVFSECDDLSHNFPWPYS